MRCEPDQEKRGVGYSNSGVITGQFNDQYLKACSPIDGYN